MLRDRPLMMGPVPVSQYPNSAWSRIPGDVKFNELWKVCGSTVEKHVDRLPQWQVYCAVYFEGLVHGSEIERERLTKKQAPKVARTWSDCGVPYES